MPATLTSSLALRSVGTVQLRAASKARPRERRFAGVAYAGGPMIGGATPRYLDLATLKIPKLPLPLLDGDNDRARVGVVESASVVQGQLRIEGRMLADSPEARNLVRDIDLGYPMESDAWVTDFETYKIPTGHREVVNGRTVIGPAEVARGARLRAGISCSISLQQAESTMSLLSASNHSRPLRRPAGGAAPRSAAKPKPRTPAAPKAAPPSLLSGGEFAPTALPSDPDRAWRGCPALRASFESDRAAFDRQVQHSDDWRRMASDDATTLALSIADPAKTPSIAWEVCPQLRQAEIAALCASCPDKKPDDPETIRLARSIYMRSSALALREGESIFARLGDKAKRPGATRWQPPRRAVAGRSHRIEPLRQRIGGGDSGVLLAALHLDLSDRHAALAGAGLRELAGD
jgi:hypothetical protein